MADDQKSENDQRQTLIDFAKSEPAAAINSYAEYKNLPIAKEVIDAALAEAPGIYFNRFQFLSAQPELQSLYGPANQSALVKAAESRPLDFLNNIQRYAGQNFAQTALESISRQNPSDVLMKADKLITSGQQKYVGQAFLADMDKGMGALRSGSLHFGQLPDTENFLAQHLSNYLKGDHDPDNTVVAVRHLNELHELPAEQRFASTRNLDASGYYTLLTEGRAEAYTSTFNHLFNQFTDHLKSEGKSLNGFLNEKPERIAHLPQLVDGVSSFGRFRDMMGNMDTSEKMMFVDTVLPSDHIDISQVIATANMVKNLPPGDPSLAHIESKILQGYASAPDAQTKDLYGVLGRWYGENTSVSADNTKAFRTLENNPRYQLPNSDRVDKNLLFDAQNRHYQLHLFYNDEDGVSSFDVFKQRMEREGWHEKTDVANGYVHFEKTEAGRQVNIYSTVPHLDGADNSTNPQAVAAIKKDIAAQGGDITFVAHRGHSYHVNDTIAELTGKEQIVYLGACGGTEYIASTLDRSPDADIIATSGEGTKYVNEPLLSDINNRILHGQSIEWREVQSVVGNIKDQRAQNYMMPNQNMAAVFISKMNALERDDNPELKSKSDLNQSFNQAVSGNSPLQAPTAAPPGPAISPLPAPASPN